MYISTLYNNPKTKKKNVENDSSRVQVFELSGAWNCVCAAAADATITANWNRHESTKIYIKKILYSLE